ncbi:MAG TPA: alanine racemase [Bacillota bacterium]|nr:alanine racemase [Bacillota bacterium]HQE66368.1 alanine racemase [Bacillota bacterium]HQI16769.1 alanine racemase [Bacillota bacterium]HQJ38058.1 alanine racemase [Bacillota bacterium]
MYDLKKIRAAWVEVDLDALAHNMREIRRLAKKDALVTAVIKADGYGHGATKIAQTLLENGADRFAVAVLDEGIELREAGFEVPILILGFTDKERAEEIVSYDLEQAVYSWELAEAISKEAVKQNKTAKIHIKVDTGMGRIGLRPDKDSVQLIKKISKLPNIAIEGIFTHFAVADTLDKTYTEGQYERFTWICGELERENVKINVKHCGNSAAIIDLPNMHLNMVRAGIILYGLKPSDEVMLDKIELKQVMSLKVRITHVKEIEAGQSVSYGRRFIAEKKSKIASLPVGYADGYTRMLSGKAEALVKGRRVPVVGRICMDQCMIDVTGIEDVKVGDEVVLFGKQGEGFIHIDELAEKLDTINYEIVCMISRRVPRVYVRNGKIVDVLNYLLD